MRLRYTPRAIADLTEIADYFISHTPVGMERVRIAIIVTLRTIVDLPYIGRRQTVDGVRKLAVRK